MKLSRFLNKQDKIEQLKLQTEERQTVFEGQLKPKKNHILFEINLIEGTIEPAKFDELPALNYADAVKGSISAKKKITRKPGCVYISALNIQNALKVFYRDYKLNETNKNG
jgi:hypothetical protein